MPASGNRDQSLFGLSQHHPTSEPEIREVGAGRQQIERVGGPGGPGTHGL